jgi:hypothetical protein
MVSLDQKVRLHAEVVNTELGEGQSNVPYA